MSEKFPNLEIIGGDSRIEAGNRTVNQGDSFNIGELKVDCLATPCHTTGHICYNVSGDQADSPAVFTGDTLFVGGCGRFFEGTAEQMYKALVEILGSLPDSTVSYLSIKLFKKIFLDYCELGLLVFYFRKFTVDTSTLAKILNLAWLLSQIIKT